MTKRIPVSLAVKSSVAAGPLAPAADQLRWIMGAPQRWRHPEMAEAYLEHKLLPRLLKKVLREDATVVDVGCHIGSFLKLATRYAPKGKHIAFEASPTKADLLRELFRTANIYNKAVSDFSGTISFLEDEKLSGTSKIGPGGISVPVCTLDEAIAGSVSLLKLDVEGHELPALIGAKQTIAKNKPTIIFECGPTAITPQRAELFDYVNNELGYGIMCFSDFLFGRGPMQLDEFRRCGIYPFRAFNFVATQRTRT